MSTPSQRPLLTIAEAAAYLNIPVTTLRDKVTQRAVPFTRIGRHVRFTDAHLAAIIAAGESQAPPPRPATAGPAPSRRARHATA
jgi:excisionase family DNA binding protein